MIVRFSERYVVMKFFEYSPIYSTTTSDRSSEGLQSKSKYEKGALRVETDKLFIICHQGHAIYCIHYLIFECSTLKVACQRFRVVQSKQWRDALVRKKRVPCPEPGCTTMVTHLGNHLKRVHSSIPGRIDVRELLDNVIAHNPSDSEMDIIQPQASEMLNTLYNPIILRTNKL